MFGRKKTYDIIYSLGLNCSAAGFLNKHYLRVSSGPFDWWMMQIPCADNWERRARLICSRFSNFLKKENLEYLELPKDTPRDTDFAPYLDHGGSDIYMPHDFPIGEPMERNYDRVKAKYDRRIARFYETIQTAFCWCGVALMISPATLRRLNAFVQRCAARSAKPSTSCSFGRMTRWLISKARARLIFGRYLCLFIPVRRWLKRLHAYFRENELNKDFSRDIRDRNTLPR